MMRAVQLIAQGRYNLVPQNIVVERDLVPMMVHDVHPAHPNRRLSKPAFSPIISICQTLPTQAGFLDKLWLSPNGGMSLGEAKLFRNLEAGREVIAQALGYARSIAG
jgi:hypothetical protein